MVWNIIIVEDDEKDMERIQKAVKYYFFQKRIEYHLELYQSTENFLSALPDLKDYILYLLDVELPGITGIELAGRVRRAYPRSVIVFITNYLDYAADAFLVNAFQYIPKKLLEERLPATLDTITGRDTYFIGKSYVIQTKRQYEHILYRDIYYLYKEKKYVIFVHAYGETRVRKSLQKVFGELDSEEFVYVDKGYVANLLHIIKIVDREAIMRDHARIPISTKEMPVVRKKIAEYWTRY